MGEMMDKRQWILDVFDGKETDRVPVGFWYHYLDDGNKLNPAPEMIRRNLEGHERFFRRFSPDFIKIMGDGYFGYPLDGDVAGIRGLSDLLAMPRGDVDGWIDAQVKFVRILADRYGEELVLLYNVFSPMAYVKRILLETGSPALIGKMFREDAEALSLYINRVGEDIARLSYRVITEGGADGIYLSVQNVQDEELGREEYLRYIAPSELAVLGAANLASPYQMLHICGFKGARNDVALYAGYPVKVFNWAVHSDHVSLREGAQIFGGRTVLGGFDNVPGSILCAGSEEEVREETRRILREFGSRRGIVLGADCTVPMGMDLKRLEWVREEANRR